MINGLLHCQISLSKKKIKRGSYFCYELNLVNLSNLNSFKILQLASIFRQPGSSLYNPGGLKSFLKGFLANFCKTFFCQFYPQIMYSVNNIFLDQLGLFLLALFLNLVHNEAAVSLSGSRKILLEKGLETEKSSDYLFNLRN